MPNIDKMQIGGETYNITIPAGLSEQEKAQIRENIGAISAGSTVVQNGTYPEMTVGNATHATNADNATKADNATNDEDGNNIGSTYLKRADFDRLILDLEHHIGSIYISISSTSPASLFGGSWAQLPEGYALWTANSGASDIISAGVPNITGGFGLARNSWDTSNVVFPNDRPNNAMSYEEKAYPYSTTGRKPLQINDTEYATDYITFSAEKSNSIYGNSTTVQPPAYKVYAWRRTA